MPTFRVTIDDLALADMRIAHHHTDPRKALVAMARERIPPGVPIHNVQLEKNHMMDSTTVTFTTGTLTTGTTFTDNTYLSSDTFTSAEIDPGELIWAADSREVPRVESNRAWLNSRLLRGEILA
jgi:hypothetical protein